MITILNSTHRKEEFRCGKASLDAYLHKHARQDLERRMSVCYVLTDNSNNDRIIGYYTISPGSIKRDLIPDAIKKKLGKYDDLPIMILGRLAVDISYHGQGYGQILLIDALKNCYEHSKGIGAWAVVVDPLDEDAKKFYLKFDFTLLDSGKMFLPMQKIEKLLEKHGI